MHGHQDELPPEEIALKEKVDQLNGLINNPAIEDRMQWLFNTGECLKNLVHLPHSLSKHDPILLRNTWSALARLLINTNILEENLAVKKYWALFFNDSRWTTAIKDGLVMALLNDEDLKMALRENYENHPRENAFLMAMRVQKHTSTLHSSLSQTNHGAEVAWIMQFKNELPNDPRFQLSENLKFLTNESSKQDIEALMTPYLSCNRPDLFHFIADLSQTHTRFHTQAQVMTYFVDALIQKYNDNAEINKVYIKFLNGIRDFGKNQPGHRASAAVFKHTLPLAAFMLTQMKEKNMVLNDILLNWYSHKQIKHVLLLAIQSNLDTFRATLSPLEGPYQRSALDTIIDYQKIGVFYYQSNSRQTLNALLQRDTELQPLNKP